MSEVRKHTAIAAALAAFNKGGEPVSDYAALKKMERAITAYEAASPPPSAGGEVEEIRKRHEDGEMNQAAYPRNLVPVYICQRLEADRATLLRSHASLQRENAELRSQLAKARADVIGECAMFIADEFSWTLPMYSTQETNELTDDVAESVREQAAVALLSLAHEGGDALSHQSNRKEGR